FRDAGTGHAARLQVAAHAQCRVKGPGPGAQLPDGLLVEVVVMVMGDDEQVDVRQVVCRINVGPGERPYQEAEGRGIAAEHGVYQDVVAIGANEIGRVPEPYYYRAAGRQR